MINMTNHLQQKSYERKPEGDDDVDEGDGDGDSDGDECDD